MERFIITVARETGSGGHNVTRRLSEALGIPYYDRDLLRKASEVSGIHERLFGAADERIGLREMLSAAEKVYTGEIRRRTATTTSPPGTSSASRRRSSRNWLTARAASSWAAAPTIF